MKKILFISNGEGRGHLTQALAFKKILENSNYKIIGCILGTTKDKKIPEYFKTNIEVPIYELESPQFIKNNNKSLSIFKTFYKNIFKIKKFIKSIRKINEIVKTEKPDIIINFYELLSGMWNIVYKNNIPTISIAHQYLIEHSEFIFPDNNILQQKILKTFNYLTSCGSTEKWCLSFYDTYDEKDLKIIPPLVRDVIFKKITTTEDFILVYLCNEGYLEDIKKEALKTNINFKVYMNTNKIYYLLDNLTVFPLSDTMFLEDMTSCKGIMMTSGFESVCEAKYLNKPCLLVPIENHYEQKCNAYDAQLINAGEYSEKFSIIKLFFYIEKYENDQIFKEWIKSSKDQILFKLNLIRI